MQRVLAYIIISLALLVLQTSLVSYLAISNIVPDVMLLWVVYIAIREGQAAGTIAGFGAGLLLDFLSGTNGMLGLSALSKTVAGFAAGYFYNENKTLQTLGSYQFVIAVTVTSLLHNVIYFLIFLQGTDVGWWGAVLRYGIPTTVYTAAFSLLPVFAYARRYLS